MSNAYCTALRIEVPRLEQVKDHRAASAYWLLLVALLERGQPMTLLEVATRFEDSGVAPAERALSALKRCRPARPPVYRDGERYALDPHDDELDRWAFRLGLRPPKFALSLVPTPSEPQGQSCSGERQRQYSDLRSSEARRIAQILLEKRRNLRPDDIWDRMGAALIHVLVLVTRRSGRALG